MVGHTALADQPLNRPWRMILQHYISVSGAGPSVIITHLMLPPHGSAWCPCPSSRVCVTYIVNVPTTPAGASYAITDPSIFDCWSQRRRAIFSILGCICRTVLLLGVPGTYQVGTSSLLLQNHNTTDVGFRTLRLGWLSRLWMVNLVGKGQQETRDCFLRSPTSIGNLTTSSL